MKGRPKREAREGAKMGGNSRASPRRFIGYKSAQRAWLEVSMLCSEVAALSPAWITRPSCIHQATCPVPEWAGGRGERKHVWPNRRKVQASLAGVPSRMSQWGSLESAASRAGTGTQIRNATNNFRRGSETRLAKSERPRCLLAHTSAKFSSGPERDLALPHTTCQGAALAAGGRSYRRDGDLDRG